MEKQSFPKKVSQYVPVGIGARVPAITTVIASGGLRVLPFEVAVAYLDSSEFQRDYGPHVDACQYCSELIDALHPTERTLRRLIRTVRDMAGVEERDPTTALTEAWSSVNAVSEWILNHEGASD